MEYFIDGKPSTPDEYIAWQAGIIEAVTRAKLPDPKYYGGSAEEGDQHEVKCAYVDGWNNCRASILAAPVDSAMAKDAERYRWLRTQVAYEGSSEWTISVWGRYASFEEALDAAIAAQIAASAEKGDKA
ncbi:hypothetical protein [Paraburkholderia franconis]|nr:hypothetical protein [Paraburkholderia franconis]